MPTTTSEPALVDTNVLVYAILRDDPRNGASRALLASARSPESRLCVAPQVIAEFYATVTRGAPLTAALTEEQALLEAKTFLEPPGLKLLNVPTDLTERTFELLRQVPVRGRHIFDLQLAATMLGNGVHRIFTYDRTHFSRIKELTVLTPKAYGEAG